MSLLEQQNVLARIYTDEFFRSEFLENPAIVGGKFGLTANESHEISQIMPEELRFFSESLFFKRLNEVRKILPLALKAIGKEEFEKFFREFSAEFKPASAKKHLEDSFQFCRFLENRKFGSEEFREIVALEKAKLLFYGYGKSFVFRLFRYDLRDLNNPKTLARNSRKLRHPAFWLRFGRKTWHRFL